MNARPLSLRRRVFWTLFVTLTSFWLVAMAVVWLVVRHEIEELLDDHLMQLAAALRPVVTATSDEGLPHSAVPYALRDEAGRLAARSLGFDNAMLAAAPEEGFGATSDHRLLAIPIGNGSLVVAAPLEERRDAAMETARALGVPLLVLVPMSLAITLLVLRRGLAPIGRLRRAIEARDATDLSPLDLPRPAQGARGSVGRRRRAPDPSAARHHG